MDFGGFEDFAGFCRIFGGFLRIWSILEDLERFQGILEDLRILEDFGRFFRDFNAFG